MNAPELKPCPFCGGAAIISRKSMDERMGYISVTTVLCAGCGARVHASDGMDENGWVKDVTSEPKAITAWNTRTPTLADVLAVSEIAALVEAAKEVGRISDRDHVAWHRLATALAALATATVEASALRGIAERDANG